MVSIAEKKNKENIKIGKVKILEGDFDELSYKNNSFDKICSVNTIYFWPEPEKTVLKVAEILKTDGLLFVAFEDIKQLKQRNLNENIFRFFSVPDVEKLLVDSDFFSDINIESMKKGRLNFYCLIAKKHT
jgi:SAM-dependent methyltransferase